MNEPNDTGSRQPVKQCKKCGGTKFHKNGNCSQCQKALKSSLSMGLFSKPCRKCGGIDRNQTGNCRPCARAARLVRAEALRHVPCSVCGSTDRNKVGNCKPCAIKRTIKWQNDNSERYRQQSIDKAYRRRAKIASSGMKLSAGIIGRLMDEQNGLCASCETDLSNGKHLDHIMPIALGGLNVDENVQLLCPTCNLRKGSKHPDEWWRIISKGP